MIAVIDYGMGNLSSVSNAVKRYTQDIRISSEPQDVKSCDKLILPGVGAFKDAYEEIVKRGLLSPVKEFIASGRPFLGICLGQQLLFDKSYEDGEHEGFGIIPGRVIAFDSAKGLKIPHMGWNRIRRTGALKKRDCPLLRGVDEDAYMYFVHSYYVDPVDKAVAATTTDYGVDFCSMLWKDNIYAMQFHPEKSQTQGLRIIENFVSM